MLRACLVFLAVILVQCTTGPKENTIPDEGARGIAAIPGLVLDKSGYAYDPNDRSCDGFPRVRVETMPGTCLGLVMPRGRAIDPQAKKGFVMPRYITQVPGTGEFLVADMGGWKANNGALFRMRPAAAGEYSLQLLKFPLNSPNGLAVGPGGYFYVGEDEKISRFRLKDGKVTDWQIVVPDLPSFKGHMHPLTQFAFDPTSGDLYINSGAPSDHCYVKGTGRYQSCPEEHAEGMGAIYRVPGAMLKNLPAGGARFYEIAASGLRNSMALAVHPSGTVVQGENSRDFPELEEPYEEINVIEPERRGLHYGWPYCYNFHATSPEWLFKENASSPIRRHFTKPVDCASESAREPGDYQAPLALMPPHVAPLHMAYYQGPMFAEQLAGKLLVSWHGYQPTGHRLVAYDVDEKGRPKADARAEGASYSFNLPGGCRAERPFRPQGGMKRHAPYGEVISGWGEIKGVRPKGAPVGFTVAADGSIWIVEDRENRVVLRLARSNEPEHRDACLTEGGEASDPRVPLLAWRHHHKADAAAGAGFAAVQEGLFKKYCAGCHGNFQETEIGKDRFSQLDFLVKNQWVVPGNAAKSKVYGAISHSGEYPPMPPGGSPQFIDTPEGDRLLKLVADWINALPGDLDKRHARTIIKEARKIRDRPTTEGSLACGQFAAGDTAYVDPRPSAQVKASGWLWAKVYLVPAHTRLFADKCPPSEDGVYYVAIRKL